MMVLLFVIMTMLGELTEPFEWKHLGMAGIFDFATFCLGYYFCRWVKAVGEE